MSDKAKYTTGADRLGITSAVICAVHCLVIPAIFLLRYSVADAGGADWGVGLPAWWEKLDYLFLLVGFVAVYHASAHASGIGIKLSLWVFWVFLAVAVVFEQYLHWLAYIASVGLIGTHFVNIRNHRMLRPKNNSN